ncbi:hypothetical protein F5888DRAFT_1890320 [Russula emetica]|nr:hypothetical protein F5888DRAFT_1890320 [Russula emetica]
MLAGRERPWERSAWTLVSSWSAHGPHRAYSRKLLMYDKVPYHRIIRPTPATLESTREAEYEIRIARAINEDSVIEKAFRDTVRPTQLDEKTGFNSACPALRLSPAIKLKPVCLVSERRFSLLHWKTPITNEKWASLPAISHIYIRRGVGSSLVFQFGRKRIFRAKCMRVLEPDKPGVPYVYLNRSQSRWRRRTTCKVEVKCDKPAQLRFVQNKKGFMPRSLRPSIQ